MSTLQQTLQQRRAEPAGVACVSAAAPVPALVVRSWQGETWVLPWSHFVSARLAEDAGRLEVAFTHCVVLVTGEHLAGLVEDLAAFRIGCLRDLPALYRKKGAEGEPFISRIEIQTTGEGKPKATRESS
jgi:hypothetical protein